MIRPRLGRPHIPRTLRGRLAAVLVVVLTVGLAAAALVMALVVRHVLIDRLDDQLRTAGNRYAVSLERDDGDADNRYGQVAGQAAGTLGARSKDGRLTDAAVVGEHDSAADIPAKARDELAELTLHPKPHSVHLHDLGDYRVIVTAGRDGDLQITGLPEEEIDETTDRLVAVVVAVFAASLLVIVLAATGLLRVMLRPLTRMSATATEIAGMPLGRGAVTLPPRPAAVRGSAGSEIDALADAFDAMLAQVEGALVTRAESEDRLRRFLADASHELRTPVAVVRSHAELARREGGDAVPETVNNSLARIIAQSERMGHLVEDLLLLARLDAGRPVAREPVDLVRVALDAVDDARHADPDHHWRLRLPENGVDVTGDAHALGQVMSNLLGNAATHTPAGCTVTVGLTTDAASDGAVRLTVADDGPGMPTAVAARPFDRFVRGAGDRADTRGSSGLGLSIVAALVQAHGGTIDLATGPAGTTVTIVLPAAGHAEDDAGG